MDLQNPNEEQEQQETPEEVIETSSVAEIEEDTVSTPETEVEGEAETVEDSEVVAEATPEEVAAESEADDEMDDENDVPGASDDDDDDDDDEEEDEEETDSADETTPPPVKKGDLIEGTIVETAPTRIMVELKEGVNGVVTSRELDRLDRSTVEEMEVGNKLLVYVVRSSGEDGYPVLSVNRAKEEQDWRNAERYADEKLVYEGRIAGYNKGGLIVRFGRLRGFIPASQISSEREQRARGGTPDERWGGMLNDPIMVKVVEVNRARNRLILSERAAAREARDRQKERLISTLKVGEIRKGTVISLTDFGAFVDLGGADGLIHLTELSWKHVNHPRDLLSEGDEVEVKVISIDPERKRIGLSRKSLENDPWDEVEQNYRENQLVQGRITKLTRFGAFASLVDNPDIEGLIHVSELADYRVEHPRDVVVVGDVLTLRVVKIDSERRRLGLSLKRVDSVRYLNEDWNID